MNFRSVFAILLMGVGFGHLAHAKMSTEQYEDSVKLVRSQARQHTFLTSDQIRLNYTVFGKNLSRPMVFVPGKGETYFDYLELAKDFMAKGWGPIFLLEPRGQGHSERGDDRKSTIHIESFDRYVQDLIEWVNGPLRAYSGQLDVVAHSMGGAIVNLALLQDQKLFRRVAYLAPMFDINMPSDLLNSHSDFLASAAAKLLCLVDCVFPISLRHATPAQGRLRQALAIEQAMRDGSHTDSVSPQWLREAIKATQTIRKNAHLHTTPTLMIAGKRDSVVENVTLKSYACVAKNCVLKTLNSTHAVHQSIDNVYDQVLSLLTQFFSLQNCESELVEESA